MYRNMIFDLGGVLIDFSPRVFLVDHFANEALENQLYDITFGSEEWLMLDAGKISRAQSNQIMRDKGAAIGRSFEVNLILSDWTDMLRTKEDTVRVAKRLQKMGYRLFYLSNMASDVLKSIQTRKFFSMFEGGLASCDIGLLKPDVRIYQALLDQYSLNPSECIFIDDSAVNAATAVEVKIPGLQFTTASQLARTLVSHGVQLSK